MFTGLEACDWRTVEVHDDRRDPEFLTGFPRSGTTLLDTILQGHRGVQVLEEESTAYRLESEFLPWAQRMGYADDSVKRQ